MPEHVVEAKKPEQSSDGTVDSETPTVSGNGTVDSGTSNVSGNGTEEPLTASGDDQEQPLTESGDDQEQPSTAPYDDLKEPPTASDGNLKKSPTALGEGHKDSSASGGDRKDSSASGGDLRDSSTVSSGGLKNPSIESMDESETLDYSFLSTLVKDVGGFQLCENLKATDFEEKTTNQGKDIPTDSISASKLKEPPSTVYVDSDSSSESESEDSPVDGREIYDIKKKILRNERLYRKAEDAKNALIELKNLDESMFKKVFDQHFIAACRSLRFKINSHVQEVNALEEQMNLTHEDAALLKSNLDPGIYSNRDTRRQGHSYPVPWENLRRLKYVIKQLVATGGVTVTPEEVKASINGNILRANFEVYLGKKEVLDKRILCIVNEMNERWVSALEYLSDSREFASTLITRETSATNPVDNLKSMHSLLRQMAADCDNYLAAGIGTALQVEEKLYEYVTENTNWTIEMINFLKLKMNLFGTIN